MSIIVEKTRAAARPTLSLDYPRQGERIESPFYTIRLSAPRDARCVEVSIDGGEWLPCREALGYYWYDWSGYYEGDHEIEGRYATAGGRLMGCEPRVVRVKYGYPSGSYN